MWTSRVQKLDSQTIKFLLADTAGGLRFDEVVDLWRKSGDFRACFTKLIRDAPFDSFFWETPPVTEQTLHRPFEFVLVESPALSQLKPDPSPFRSHFASRAGEEVLTFPNLGGDALLVVPAPLAEAGSYTHLARFLRGAPQSQVDTFWGSVGVAMRNRISHSPIWLSTAGLGVSWLHLRLDSHPKYYWHEPYKTQT